MAIRKGEEGKVKNFTLSICRVIELLPLDKNICSERISLTLQDIVLEVHRQIDVDEDKCIPEGS